MSVVLLVRHGQASFGAKDYDALSPTGHEQARVLGQALAARGLVPDVVVRGELRRHQETADGLLEGAGWDVDPVVDPGWDEFDHLRVIEAHRPAYRSRALMKADLARTLKPTRAFQDMFEEATRRWSSGEHDADYEEPFSAFAARVVTALKRTAEHDGLVVVVTSGGPISVCASHLLTGDVTSWRRINAVTVNTGLTKVVSGSRGLTCVSLNDHAHLEHDRRLLTYR